MDEELYKKVKAEYLNFNRKALNRQDMLTGSMVGGCAISYLISAFVPEMADVCSNFMLCFAASAFTSSMISLVMRYFIARDARNYATSKSNTYEENPQKKFLLTDVFPAEEVEPLNEEDYPEIYFQAIALKDYIEAVNFEGAGSLVKLLDSLMSQLQKPISDEWQEAYENVISKIADCAYNNALKAYNLPYEEKEEYDLNELVLKAKVLENYVMDIAYYGYEYDLNFLYQAISESKRGGITPENFNEWIHYIAQKAYQSALNEGVTR